MQTLEYFCLFIVFTSLRSGNVFREDRMAAEKIGDQPPVQEKKSQPGGGQTGEIDPEAAHAEHQGNEGKIQSEERQQTADPGEADEFPGVIDPGKEEDQTGEANGDRAPPEGEKRNDLGVADLRKCPHNTLIEQISYKLLGQKNPTHLLNKEP